MRRLALLLVAHVAAAEPVLRHEDVELVRPELRSLTATAYEGKVAAVEQRSYDAGGHIVRHEYRKAGKLIAAWDFTWDAQGRLASRKTRDGAGALVERRFTYQVDATGRIVERIMRDPAAPAGEYLRDVYAWAPDGSHTVTTSRHYPKEGPYAYATEVYDAAGRLERDCLEHSGCSLYEYDAHGNLSRVREQHQGDHHWYRTYDNVYDAAGRLVKRTVGGSEHAFRANARGEVVEVIVKTAGTQTLRTVYTYDYR